MSCPSSQCKPPAGPAPAAAPPRAPERKPPQSTPLQPRPRIPHLSSAHASGNEPLSYWHLAPVVSATTALGSQRCYLHFLSKSLTFYSARPSTARSAVTAACAGLQRGSGCTTETSTAVGTSEEGGRKRSTGTKFVPGSPTLVRHCRRLCQVNHGIPHGVMYCLHPWRHKKARRTPHMQR